MATSYANPGGTGNRAGIITVTANFAPNVGTVPTIVNGNFTDTSANAFWSNAAATGLWILFDFGSGNAQLIDEVTWYQSGGTAMGTWRWQGSQDNASWDSIGSPFTLGGIATQVQTALAGNAQYYRYYRLLGVSGSLSSTPWVREIEFQLEQGTPVHVPVNFQIAQAPILVLASLGAPIFVSQFASLVLARRRGRRVFTHVDTIYNHE